MNILQTNYPPQPTHPQGAIRTVSLFKVKLNALDETSVTFVHSSTSTTGYSKPQTPARDTFQ